MSRCRSESHDTHYDQVSQCLASTWCLPRLFEFRKSTDDWSAELPASKTFNGQVLRWCGCARVYMELAEYCHEGEEIVHWFRQDKF